MQALDESAVVYQIVLTKADKLKAGELGEIEQACAKAIEKRPAAHPRIAPTSAETGEGIELLRAEIASLAKPQA
jgi:GTP-binding protein